MTPRRLYKKWVTDETHMKPAFGLDLWKVASHGAPFRAVAWTSFDDTHQSGPAKHAKRTAFDTHPWWRTPSVVIPERRSQVNFGNVQKNLGMRKENADGDSSSHVLHGF